jgi:hypothetical protein
MATKSENMDLVDIFIERASGNDEPNLMVGINGVNYLLPKGKTSKVPKAVYEEIMRSRRAQATADEAIDGMKEAAKQPK